MSDLDARALLTEALELLNDHPRFSLRRDRKRTSYALAARIEAHLEAGATVPFPRAETIRALTAPTEFVPIDADPGRAVRDGADLWVRAWVRLRGETFGAADLDQTERYRSAVAELPEPTRSVFLAHRRDDMSYPEIATSLDITVHEVERHIGVAIATIARALGKG